MKNRNDVNKTRTIKQKSVHNTNTSKYEHYLYLKDKIYHSYILIYWL